MRGALLFSAIAVTCAAQVYQIETAAGSGSPGFAGDRGSVFRAQLNEPSSVALDASGRLYIADSQNNRVRRLELNGTIVTVAGNGERGRSGDLGPATNAAVTVSDVVVGPDGVLYIAGGDAVRAVNREGVIWTISGVEAGLTEVTSVAAENRGSLLVADAGRLRRVAPDGTPTDVPLNGVSGPLTEVALGPDGTIYVVAGETIQRIDASGNATPVIVDFSVNASTRLAVDSRGELNVASAGRVWKIAGGRSWILAGTDQPGFSGDGGPGILAQLNSPGGLTVDAVGNLYFADTFNHRVRALRVPFAGSILALSPTPRATGIWPVGAVLRWTPLVNAESYELWFGTDPGELTRLAETSESFYALQRLSSQTTYYWRVATRFPPLPAVSSPVFSFTTTTATEDLPLLPSDPQPFNLSVGLPTTVLLTWRAVGAARYEIYLDESEYVGQRVGFSSEQRFVVGNLRPNTKYYWRVLAVNDRGSQYSPRWEFTTAPANGYPYIVDTLAGTPLPIEDGTIATEAVLDSPRHVVAAGQNEILFVEGNRRVRRIDAEGRLRTVYTSAVADITGLTVDTAGNILVALPEYVLRISRTNQRTVLAGQPGRRGYSGDGAVATAATLDGISGIAVDRRGNVFISDTANHRVRVVGSNGQIRTYAGTGNCASTEPGGGATSTPFCAPGRIATDSSNNLYVATSGWVLRVRTDGIVESVATAPAGAGLALDQSGSVLLADFESMTIRRAMPDGTVENFAGESDFDSRAFGFAGDGLPAARGRFAFPEGLAVDPAGNVLIADTGNDRIRRIDTAGFLSTIAGTDTARGDRGPSAGAWLNRPTDVAVDVTGNVYIADSGNDRVRRVTPTRFLDTLAGGAANAIQDIQAGASRVGKNGRELGIDLSRSGIVETDDAGSVLFTDDRYSWLTAEGTTAIYTLNVGGGVTAYLDSRIKRVGGLARGPSGEVYVSDTLGHRILRIDGDGPPTVVAGSGAPGFAGEGGPASVAQVHTPRALSIAPDGTLYVAEFGRVRRITSDGRIVTVINEHANGLAHDRLGTLYLTAGRSVFSVSGNGTLRRIAGRENAPAGQNDGSLGLDVRLNDPRGIAATREGDLFVADTGDHLVRRLIPNIPASLTIFEGDGQTIGPEQPARPLSVRITGRSGRPVPGVAVTFAVLSPDGNATVAGVRETNINGIASLSPFFGTRTGQITFRATAIGLPPVEFRVTVQ